MFTRSVRRNSAFSLIELVIVVVIIGIIAAIAIPRMSRGAAGANDSALQGNLAILRKAVDLYAAEHSGAFPTDTTTITNQLTSKTDATGTVGATSAFIYGPYIRLIPKLNVGSGVNRGTSAFTTTANSATAAGWVYDNTLGTVKPNVVLETDSASVLYNTY